MEDGDKGWRVDHKRSTKPTTVISVDLEKGDWEQWFLLRADAHHDNPKCRHDIERKHLDEAVKKNAGVLDFGDLFCAMQGKYDPRKSKSAVRPEHQRDNYLDALVKTAADFYEPYAHHFAHISPGNHETAILKNCESFLSERLVASLNDRTGSSIRLGGYSGFVRFMFKYKLGDRKTSVILWYTHGYGGDGVTNKGMTKAHRQREMVEGVDIMCSSHSHWSWYDPGSIKTTLNLRTNQSQRRQVRYIKLGTYKDAYGHGEKGWEIEKGHPPKPLGAWWLRFYWDRAKEDVNIQTIETAQ